MAFGFRVFTVQLVEGMGRKALDRWQVGSRHYAGYAHDLLAELATPQALLAARMSWGEVQALDLIGAAESAAPGDRFVRWMSSSLSGRRVSVELKYGTVGNYSDAMGIAGDTPIQDKAPSRQYRAELLLPPDDGQGLLAVEAIGRTAPSSSIALWLGIASRVREAGKTWWRPKINQVTDAEYLTELIGKSRRAEVTLKHVGYDDIGDRPRTQYRLEAPLNDRQRESAVSWIRSRIGGHGKADLQGMLEIVGVGDTGDLQFTDGAIKVDDGETRTRIGLSDVREIFTYPVSNDRPDAEAWRNAVRKRFQQIDPQLQWT